MKQLKKYWHLFWFFRKTSLMKMTAYRTDFFFWFFVSLMWTSFNFFFFSLLIRLSNNIAGWFTWELYTLLSIFTMVDAFTWSLMYNNMNPYTSDIFQGRLSNLLTKPIDTQFVIMTRETSYNNVPRFFVGLFALFWSLHKLNYTPNLASIILFVLTFSAGVLLVYTIWFAIATLAFWVERLDNINNIVPGMRRIWQVPRQVYGGFTSTFLTVILPLGLVSSIPSEVLLNKPTGIWTSYLIVISFIFFILARKFFHFSIKKYTSVGG